MKIAVLSNLVDIREIRIFAEAFKKHEFFWITDKYYFEGREGNLCCVNCCYPNQERKNRNFFRKALYEVWKLATPIRPEFFIGRSAEYPCFDDGFLAEMDLCIPLGDLEAYCVLKLRKEHHYRYKTIFRDAETIPFLYQGKSDMRHVWKAINRETNLFLPWTNRIRNKEIIEGVDPGRSVVLYDGIYTDNFRKKPKDMNLVGELGLSGETVLMTVGKIEENKGLDFLLEADGIMKKKGFSFVHYYLGNGKLFDSYLEQARKMGLDKCSRFTGFIPNKDLCRYLNLADVFIHGSISLKSWEEQFGIALVEAMSCELPIVTTYCGSIPEVVGDAAVLVHERSAAEICGAVLNLVAHPGSAARLGKMARERAVRLFDTSVISARFLEIIENLCRE
ncbi:MAG: glycosyltransferase [Candidatus Wallbacteria bacterium]|nr:glycosyltransferase [Candidatus Wallbacteria bacterium]